MKIPFTNEQFFEIMEMYNISVFPAQVVLILLGVAVLYLLHSGTKNRNTFIPGILAIFWLWMGIVYHWTFFTRINPAAWFFGGLFILQGLFFLWETFRKKRLEFIFTKTISGYVGYFLVIFGLVIYPALFLALGKSPETTIVLGLPCPTTIFTFGLFLLTSGKFPKYLLIIPVLWSLIGTSAAFKFGVLPDYMLIISAIIALWLIFTKKTVPEK